MSDARVDLVLVAELLGRADDQLVGVLDHAAEEVRDAAGGVRRVVALLEATISRSSGLATRRAWDAALIPAASPPITTRRSGIGGQPIGSGRSARPCAYDEAMERVEPAFRRRRGRSRSAWKRAGYLCDDSIATVVHLADRLQKPLLVEGPAGVGKTELAESRSRRHWATISSALQCYEGVDETKTLYEWNYRKQLLRIQAGQGTEWDELSEDIFSEPFLLERPVLRAIRSEEPVVLLIDEIDKLDFEAEALLLEVLSDWQVSIPEMGTVQADVDPARRPHLEQRAGALGSAEAEMPLPLPRLPNRRAREGDRARTGPRGRAGARREAGRRRRFDPRARAEEGSVDRRDDSTGRALLVTLGIIGAGRTHVADRRCPSCSSSRPIWKAAEHLKLPAS